MISEYRIIGDHITDIQMHMWEEHVKTTLNLGLFLIIPSNYFTFSVVSQLAQTSYVDFVDGDKEQAYLL